MLSKKNLSVISLIVSLLFIVVIIMFSLQINGLISELMRISNGSCFIDGQCTHQKSNIAIYLGVLSLIINTILSILLFFSYKSESEVNNFVKKENKIKETEEKFNILLKGLDEDEKKIIKAVREQDGISQSTLRIRTDMSKAKLSIVLSNLEKKNLIKKIPEGKFNKIFIKTHL